MFGSKIENNEIGGTCSTYVDMTGIYRILVRKPQVKRSLGKPRYRCEDKIKINFQKIGFWDRKWIELTQDRER
jgi:hypothetical protein